MLLTRCTNFAELLPFLKLDYANNLYFFTYASELRKSEVIVLVGKFNRKIVFSILLTPVHCCVSCTDINYIELISDQLPPVTSVHVLGKRDLVEKLMQVTTGPVRDNNLYSFNRLTSIKLSLEQKTTSIKASKYNLNDLIDFYNNNDMLIDCGTRLLPILNWGKVYFVRKDNKIVSCALTTTETNDAAMIGAVFTEPEHRNKGYAKDCVLNLCKELILNNKTPYLFYESGSLLLTRMYTSLGFSKINSWLVATRK